MDKLQIFLYPKKNQSTDSFDQINPSTRRIHSRALPEGRELVIRGSRDGRSQDGEIVREPISKVIMEGVSNYKNYDVEQLQEEKMLLFEATGYSPHAQSTAPFDDGFSAIGLPAGYGMIAVDPSIIPLGTRVFVEGYGYAIAADVGADIQGRRVDLCFETHNNALQFGRKWVKVHILG